MTDFLIHLKDYLPGYFKAFGLVLEITVMVVLLSFLLALMIVLCRFSSLVWIKKFAESYITFFRGTPALIHIFIIYFGLPQFGLPVSPIVGGIIALSIGQSAYLAEIIRSGINGVSRAQREAALDLGCTPFQCMRHIILPQALIAMIPAFAGELMAISKNTSLLSAITVMEITHYTQLIIAQTFKPFDFYFILALFYLIFSALIVKVSKRIERKYAA